MARALARASELEPRPGERNSFSTSMMPSTSETLHVELGTNGLKESSILLKVCHLQ